MDPIAKLYLKKLEKQEIALRDIPEPWRTMVREAIDQESPVR